MEETAITVTPRASDATSSLGVNPELSVASEGRRADTPHRGTPPKEPSTDAVDNTGEFFDTLASHGLSSWAESVGTLTSGDFQAVHDARCTSRGPAAPAPSPILYGSPMRKKASEAPSVQSVHSETFSLPPVVNALSLTEFQDTIAVRGVSPHVLLHCAGYLLKNGRQRRNDHQLSQELEEDVLDYFVSHSWAVGRWRKFMALALFFNVRPAVAASVVCQLLMFVGIITDRLQIRANQFRIFPDDNQLSLWCSVMGTLSFWAVIFVWHERPRWCQRRQYSAFFDTVCIDQSDAAKQREGIDAITAYLCHSNTLLVVLSDLYLQRIWTVFELTTFLALCPEGKVMVQPVGLAEITFWCGMLQWLRPAFVAARANFMDFAETQDFGRLAFAVVSLLIFELETLALVLVLRKWGIARSQLAHDIQTFTFSSAKCHHEPDRSEIFTAVRHLAINAGLTDMDATREEACAAMEDRARELVPEFMQGALSPAGLPSWNAIVIALPGFAGMLDEVALRIRDADFGNQPLMGYLRIVAVNIVTGLNMPVALGIVSVLVCYPRRSRCAEALRTLIYMAIMTFLIVMLRTPVSILYDSAMGSTQVLILTGFLMALQSLILWCCYGKGVLRIRALLGRPTG